MASRDPVDVHSDATQQWEFSLSGVMIETFRSCIKENSDLLIQTISDFNGCLQRVIDWIRAKLRSGEMQPSTGTQEFITLLQQTQASIPIGIGVIRLLVEGNATISIEDAVKFILVTARSCMVVISRLKNTLQGIPGGLKVFQSAVSSLSNRITNLQNLNPANAIHDILGYFSDETDDRTEEPAASNSNDEERPDDAHTVDSADQEIIIQQMTTSLSMLDVLAKIICPAFGFGVAGAAGGAALVGSAPAVITGAVIGGTVGAVCYPVIKLLLQIFGQSSTPPHPKRD